MVTYDVVGFRTAFNNYLQNPSQYPEPNWSSFVIPDSGSSGSTPSGGTAAIPAPHVDSPQTGSDQQVPPTLQNTIADTSKNKINEVIETKQQPQNKTDIGIGKFGGEAGQYGNPVEVVAPAKIVTNVEPIVSKVQPLVGNGSIDETGQFGKTIADTVLPTKSISNIPMATIPKLTPQTPAVIPVENKMQKVPLTQSQVNDIHTYAENVTKSLTDAKANGATTINAIVNGKVVDTFPVNDKTKEVLFAALPELQKNYGSVSLGYAGAKTETTTTQKIPLTEDQINKVHVYTENIIQTVQEAKASGAKNILVLDQSGKQIDSIPVGQDTTRILFSAVPNLQKEGKQITLSYTPQMKNVLPANYTPSYEEDVKTYGKDQVNVFTEIVKGSNEGITDLLNEGKAAATYIWSGGKIVQNPQIKGDILSNTLTSPIKTTVDSSGKTTTTINAENARTGLLQVQSDIEKNPARQFGRLLPSIESMIGTGLASEGVGTLVKGGSSLIGKVGIAVKGEQPSLFISKNIDLGRSLGTKIPNSTPSDFVKAVSNLPTKSSTGILSDVTANSGTGVLKGITENTSILKNGGRNVKTNISTYSELNNYLKQTGVFGKVEETNKASTGVFSGEGSGKIITSTPDKTGKLSYISGEAGKLGSSEKGLSGKNGGLTSETKSNSIIQSEPIREQPVAKTIQKQLEENQKKIQSLYGNTESKTKTTTKTDQAMKEYNDVLAGRKSKMKQIIADQESIIYIPRTKVINVPKQEQIFQVENVFEPLQKQTEEIITVPKQETKNIFVPTTTHRQVTILDIPTGYRTIPKIPVPTVIEIPTIPITKTIPIEIPVTITENVPVDVPFPDETTPPPPDIFGGGKPFTPQGGSTGGFEPTHGSKKRLFVDYDVSEDPLGISQLGKAEYNLYGNKPEKITQVKVKTPTSKTVKLPKYSLKGMFKLPKKRKK